MASSAGPGEPIVAPRCPGEVAAGKGGDVVPPVLERSFETRVVVSRAAMLHRALNQLGSFGGTKARSSR